MTTADAQRATSANTRTVRHVPVPATRDPFVNTPLIRVKQDERGVEWFWITSYNHNSGCIGVLVSELGEHRIYRFPPPHAGFYSAVAEDDDTLWLCGSLARVVRLTLSSGAYEAFATGAPDALVFQGMAYDPATKKLFAAAYPFTSTSDPYSVTTAFSFDTVTRQGVKVYRDTSPEHYMRFSFPNGDGTYTIALQVPGKTLLRWDPAAETLERTGISACDFRFISDDRGHYYLPGQGWYDPLAGTINTDGARPEKEMLWIDRQGDTIFGVERSQTQATIHTWNLPTGAVKPLCGIPEAHNVDLMLTASGKIVAVNMYGVFYRFDIATGALEMTRVLPTDAVGHTDCIRRIDEHRLLGTPFITQRFWEVNLDTGEGRDCGKAAPGGGEVLQTWRLNGKIYLAAYTGGELVEYDPAVHPHFPENPRVVADPPEAMRPVAAADDGRHIYYACSVEYGHLGSVLAKYDTLTGLASYAAHPLPDQQICELAYDAPSNTILCGTTYHSDCQSCPPSTDRCYVAKINADTLHVEGQFAAPEGTVRVSAFAPLEGGTWFCFFYPICKWCEIDPMNFRAPAEDELRDFPTTRNFKYPGIPGKLLVWVENRLELWDIRTMACERLVMDEVDCYNYMIDEGSLYLMRPQEIVVIDNYLAP